MLVKICACLLLVFPIVTLAGSKMPCEAITSELNEYLSYYSKEQAPGFLECVSKYRVCAVADNHVVAAESIQSINTQYAATTLVVVQSPPDEKAPLCLAGIYSGGSAASWMFKAYKVINQDAIAYVGMDDAYAQGDVVSPKDAANVTVSMFNQYAKDPYKDVLVNVDRKKSTVKNELRRSDDDIQKVFVNNKDDLYQIYFDELQSKPGLAGKLVLKLTILPSGKVEGLSVASNTIGNPSFVKKICARVEMLDFGIMNVKKETILYPMHFEPGEQGWQGRDAGVVDLENGLIKALKLKQGTTERIADSGKAIQAYMREGIVGRKPNQRYDYTDYYLLKKSASLMGHELIVIEEEYLSKYIGCCVNPGVGVSVRVVGSTKNLQEFASANKCTFTEAIDLQNELLSVGVKANLSQGSYANLSCRERDAFH